MKKIVENNKDPNTSVVPISLKAAIVNTNLQIFLGSSIDRCSSYERNHRAVVKGLCGKAFQKRGNRREPISDQRSDPKGFHENGNERSRGQTMVSTSRLFNSSERRELQFNTKKSARPCHTARSRKAETSQPQGENDGQYHLAKQRPVQQTGLQLTHERDCQTG